MKIQPNHGEAKRQADLERNLTIDKHEREDNRKKEKENLERTDTKVKAGARHREQAAALVV
jgi:hypothetical protein